VNSTRKPGKIFAASILASLLAAAVLITVVLPAEYGGDPTGSGAALGLLVLAAEEHDQLQQQSFPWRSDSIEFPLLPFESVEYKYRLKAGAVLLYDWRSEQPVLFELHAEPEGAVAGYAERFAKDTSSHRSGVYTAAYNGIHGWFWQNRSKQEVTIRLRSAGFFSYSLELRDGHSYQHSFDAEPAAAPQKNDKERQPPE
jgi:hypothetical protein